MSKRHQLVLICLVLSILAAIPRFYALGSQGFYGDEEYTAFVAQSVAEGNGAKMPSGMSYYRALPQTWATAVSARIFGFDKEISYRIPAAVLGVLTVPLLFLMARPIVGGGTALVAAVLLAFSEWHITLSREARMYAPFLFFYIIAAFGMWRWAETRRWHDFVVGAVGLVGAVSLHALGILGTVVAVLPIALAGWLQISMPLLVGTATAMAAGALAYDRFVVASAYSTWMSANGSLPGMTAQARDAASDAVSSAFGAYSILTLVCAASGVALGLWISGRARVDDREPGWMLRAFGRYALAAVGGGMMCTGQLHAAAIAWLLFFVMHPSGGIALAKKIWWPAAIAMLIGGGWAVWLIGQYGIPAGIKAMVIWPFPYLVFLAQMFPGVFLLFIGMCVYLALRAYSVDERVQRASVFAVLVPLAAIGLVRNWGASRYLIETYPFLLVLAASGLFRLLEYGRYRTGRWKEQTTVALAIVISLSGLLGGHGVPQAVNAALLEPGGELTPLAFELRPDHRSAGKFVRERLALEDIVIAEDSSQQRWYVGRVDYWLRNPLNRYLYRAADGQVRDIYVNSVPATAQMLKHLSETAKGRVWVITSGETYNQWKYYLDAEQQQWLGTLAKTVRPVFIASDGVTKVYCLKCASIGQDHETQEIDYSVSAVPN